MGERNGLSGRVKRLLSPVVAMVTLGGAFVGLTEHAGATATDQAGYACAYRSNISLFGGPYSVRGCGQTIPPGTAESASPHVTLPAGGTSSYISATDYDGAKSYYGPAVMFSGQYDANDNLPPSGQLSASTTGTSTVVSTATASSVGPGPFVADYVMGRCTASTSNKTFTVQYSNAVVVTSTDADGYPLTTANVPSSPPPGYTIPFQINHVGDHGYMVFNERITNPDGSVTLNAARMVLQGPIALGDQAIGQANCRH